MQLVLFNPLIGPNQVLPFRSRVDAGAMVTKVCSAFPKAPASLEPHHQIVKCHIQDTRWGGGLTPLQRCSRCILLPQPTGQLVYTAFFNSCPFKYRVYVKFCLDLPNVF